MRNINIILRLFFMLILLFILNSGCRKPDTCLLPEESEIAAMEAKWLHYKVGDTLKLISNKGDTNIYYCESIESWVEEENENNTYYDGVCGYVYSTRFSSDFYQYNNISYFFFKNGVQIYCGFEVKSNNTIFVDNNSYINVTYMDSITMNNNSFSEIYKIHRFNNVNNVNYDFYYSPSVGLIKLSISNDSLYFMPEEYW